MSLLASVVSTDPPSVVIFTDPPSVVVFGIGSVTGPLVSGELVPSPVGSDVVPRDSDGTVALLDALQFSSAISSEMKHITAFDSSHTPSSSTLGQFKGLSSIPLQLTPEVVSLVTSCLSRTTLAPASNTHSY